MEFSMKLEIVALLINMLLLLFHYDYHNRKNTRYRLFHMCLLFSSLAIGMDILSTLAIEGYLNVPDPITSALTTWYFIAQYVSFSVTACYCFYLIFEHLNNRKAMRHIINAILGMLLIVSTLQLTNYWTHWFFYFENGQYFRGPLNKLGYLVLGIEVALLCICFIRNFSIISRSMRKLIVVLPPLVTILAITQLQQQNVLLNGTISALVNLLFFMSFQSNRVGQDSLTELPNRNTFFQELSARKNKNSNLHIVLVHLDGFDAINKQYGTRGGDALLFHIARYLERVSPHYQVFRFGNTRFLLLGSERTVHQAEALVRHLQHRFERSWDSIASDCKISVSIAHLLLRTSEIDESRLIDQMEYTLTQAREQSETHAVFFDHELSSRYDRRIYVMNQIQNALENESFQVYYQPVYSCADNAFTTAESLIRLFDENGTPISPGEFIPLAEQNNLIDAITWQLLEKICRFLSDHPDLPLQSISINVPMHQLTSYTLWLRLQNLQAQYGIPLDRFRIEITERTIAENPQLVRTTMEHLSNAGLKFYLDDFGIGYSNLSSMLSLPFETIKLDSSLIRKLDNDLKSYEILKLLIQMLHHADFTVVAEGLENESAVQLVRALDVDRIQGFYYAKPMNESDLLSFLHQKNRQGDANDKIVSIATRKAN